MEQEGLGAPTEILLKQKQKPQIQSSWNSMFTITPSNINFALKAQFHGS